MKDDVYMSREEVMVYLKIKRTTLQRWMKQPGFPPYFKPARRVLFRRADIDKWLLSHRVK